MDSSAKQLISENAAKLIVKYDFEKSKSDADRVMYRSLFDQKILAARGIELIEGHFGIDFDIVKTPGGVGLVTGSGYTLKWLPDSSWDPILADTDKNFATYYIWNLDSYYTKAMNLLEKTILDKWPALSSARWSGSFYRKADYDLARFSVQIPTDSGMDIWIVFSIMKFTKTGKFEIQIGFNASTACVYNSSSSFNSKMLQRDQINGKFNILDLAIQEIKKYTGILTR